ncbi:alcohol dehydrogenase [Fusarium albosuccineum]|uniref:Alcohol dehydrogenase n=1 Tax=Fusarium albosuccineum TaxID=1237068 RepID=A0A8H4PBK6_9HYPO|nr:alcohol dehydrogenase [Fusarium albosuccineum]
MSTHTAAWIKTKFAALEVGPAETPAPGAGELLVKAKFIAFSPIESKVQKIEIHPMTYPNILGLSFSGVVESVGPDVEGFAVGDNVAVVRPNTKANDHRFGAFQQYALACADTTSKLPSSDFLESGAVTVLNLGTVTAACSHFLGLDKPSLNGPKSPTGKKVLIYGGSSSCGGLAIRYARAAGYQVVTTSSPKNHDYVDSLGPVAVIDHTQSPERIVQDLQVNGPYHRIFDTVGIPPVTNLLIDYLSSVGGGVYNTLIPVFPGTKEIPDNVERRFESYSWIFSDPKHEELKKWYYQTLVPQGLASGVIVPTPSQRVSGGLDKTQHALDIMGRGEVSGHKLVMDPWE